MSRYVASIAFLLPTLVACEPALDACESAGAYDASIVMGSGENQFLSLEDGEVVTMHSGIQGGFHVYGSIRTQGLVPGRDLIMGGVDSGVEVVFELYSEDADVGYGMRSEAVLSGDESDAELLGQLVYLDFWDLEYDEEEDSYVSIDPTEIEFTMEVQVTDSCGVTVSDSRQVYLDYD